MGTFTDTLDFMEKDTLYVGEQNVLISSSVPALVRRSCGRDSDDHQSAVLYLVVERLQPRILRRITAPRSNVHKEKNFAFVGGHFDRLAVD